MPVEGFQSVSGSGVPLTLSLTVNTGDVLLAVHGADYFPAEDMASPSPGEWSLLAVADYGYSGPKLKSWARTVSKPGEAAVTADNNGDASNFLFLYRLPSVSVADGAGYVPAEAANNADWKAPPVDGATDGVLVCAWLGIPFFTTNITTPPGMIKDGEEDTGRCTGAVAHEALTAGGPTGERLAQPDTANDYASLSVSFDPSVAALRLDAAASVPSLTASATVLSLEVSATVATLTGSARVVDEQNYASTARALGS